MGSPLPRGVDLMLAMEKMIPSADLMLTFLDLRICGQLKHAQILRLECGPAWTLAVIAGEAAGTKGCRCLLWGSLQGGSAFETAVLETGLCSASPVESGSKDGPVTDRSRVVDRLGPVEVPLKLVRLLDAPLELCMKIGHPRRDFSRETGIVMGNAGDRQGSARKRTLPCNPSSYLDEVERACDPEGIGSARASLMSGPQASKTDGLQSSSRAKRAESFDDMYASYVPPSSPHTPRSRCMPCPCPPTCFVKPEKSVAVPSPVHFVSAITNRKTSRLSAFKSAVILIDIDHSPLPG